MYLTTVMTGSDGGAAVTRTTIVDRLTGAQIGFVDVEGRPTTYVLPSADDNHLLQVTESTDAAFEKRTTLAVIDTRTATVIGGPTTFDSALHTVLYTADGSHIVAVTQPGKETRGPVGTVFFTRYSGPTTFTLIDMSTGAVVGDPLVIDSTFTHWAASLGNNGDRAIAVMSTRDEADTPVSHVYVLDIDGNVTAT